MKKDQQQRTGGDPNSHQMQNPTGNHDQIVKNISRALDMGSIMRVILMQHDGIRIVQQIIKTTRKIKESTFLYKQILDFSFDCVKKKMFNTVNQPELISIANQVKSKESSLQKQINSEVAQAFRDQIIENLVQQLYNARQTAQKIGEIDLSQSSSSNEEATNDQQKDIKEYLSVAIKKQSDNNQKTILQLKKTIADLQVLKKSQNKIIQDSAKSLLEKQQKITNLKNTISKLQQHIIRQAKIQGENQNKTNLQEGGGNLNQAEKKNLTKQRSFTQLDLTKSQNVERENMELKKQIQKLKFDLHKSAQLLNLKSRQLLSFSSKTNMNQQLQRQKQSQFLALSKEFALVKQQVSFIINGKKSKIQIEIKQNLSSEENYSEQNQKRATILADLEITNQKYKKLQKIYLQLKQQNQRLLNIAPPIIKKCSQLSFPSGSDICFQNQTKYVRNNSQSNQKKEKEKYKKTMTPILKKIGQSKQIKKGFQFVSDDDDQKEQILKDIKQINKIQQFSDSLSISNFSSLINPKEMANKIQGFDFTNSVIHKINTSKFIQSFDAKISFILQYTCLLELYFNRSFLSSIRQQLMMQETIKIKQITVQNLNPVHFNDHISNNNQNSFSSSSKISNGSNKMYINTQFSISQYSNSNISPGKKKEQQIGDSTISLPNLSSNKQKFKKARIQRLQSEMKQLSSLLPKQLITGYDLKEDQQFMSEIHKLKQNGIAQFISNLIKQNQVFKKCLNQMIRNQQNFTKLNNQIYFDEDGQLRRRSNSSNFKRQQNKQKQNCNIM